MWDRWHGATLWAMRNSSRISFAGVALALSITTAPPVPAQDRNVTLTESQNGGSAELAKDQKLEIRLPVQGGTGFSWELMRPPRAPVRLLSSNAQPAGPGNLPGGPATQLFVFEPTGAGSHRTWLPAPVGEGHATRAHLRGARRGALAAGLSHAELLLQAGRRGRVLEHEPLVRIDVVVSLLRHQGGLVEAA